MVSFSVSLSWGSLLLFLFGGRSFRCMEWGRRQERPLRFRLQSPLWLRFLFEFENVVANVHRFLGRLRAIYL